MKEIMRMRVPMQRTGAEQLVVVTETSVIEVERRGCVRRSNLSFNCNNTGGDVE